MDLEKFIEDLSFINSREGRSVRILAEFLETKTKLEQQNINDTIVVFGSARILSEDAAAKQLELAIANNANIEVAKKSVEISRFYTQATELAGRLALWSKEIMQNKYYICTGGGPGIMEAANKGCFDVGEKSLGFNIVLPFEQHANKYIDKDLTFYFNYFFLRKFWFSYLAKAFIAFPGGFGTFDELFEVLTLIQTHKMKKVIPIVLFGKEFFNSFMNMDVLAKYSLIKESDKDLYIITDSVDEAFHHITTNMQPYTKE